MGGVEITALTTLVGVLVWYVKYTTKQNAERESDAYKERVRREDKHDAIQKEDREFSRGLITNELKENSILHNQSVRLIKVMNKNLEDHNGHSQKAWNKTIKSLDIIADRMNGDSPASKAIKKELEMYRNRENTDRRKVIKKVEVERRK